MWITRYETRNRPERRAYVFSTGRFPFSLFQLLSARTVPVAIERRPLSLTLNSRRRGNWLGSRSVPGFRRVGATPPTSLSWMIFVDAGTFPEALLYPSFSCGAAMSSVWICRDAAPFSFG